MFCSRITSRILIILFLVCCSHAMNSLAMDFAVSDVNLQKCLTEQAQKNNWTTIESVIKIECHSKDIASIDGIEQFSNLQTLSLYNNKLTSVSLKKLPQLKHLNLAKNSLKAFDVTDMPVLEELYIFNNKLTQLTLNGLPKLKLLKANENQLLTFTYSELPQLEKIYIFNNKMVNVDIYHLPQMHYMDCRQNPMPTKLYDEMNALKGVTFLHDGNAKDWQ